MVSVYPNPPPGQDFPNHLYSYYKDADIINDQNFIDWNMDDSNKKVRKPYTITKSRDSWSEQEHDKFLEAIQLFDRDWKKIGAFVGSKTVIQIRSHAQKYFLKVQKNGTSEHVPPPRPKRKAAHPYPQKASKNVRQDSVLVPGTSISSAPLSSWTDNVMSSGPGVSDGSKDDLDSAGVTTTHNYSSSSNERTPHVPTYDKKNHLHGKEIRVVPNFAEVYRFIGSIFDPYANNHLQRLKEMDPINMETALMLMKNLSGNLVSPEFENHKNLLSSRNAGVKEEDCTAKMMTSG